MVEIYIFVMQVYTHKYFYVQVSAMAQQVQRQFGYHKVQLIKTKPLGIGRVWWPSLHVLGKSFTPPCFTSMTLEQWLPRVDLSKNIQKQVLGLIQKPNFQFFWWS